MSGLLLGILVGIYALGYLHTLRWFVGWWTMGKIDDWNEFAVGTMFGLFVSVVWPFVKGYRLAYKSWVRFGPEEKDMKVHLSRLFPEPKPLETKKERTARLLKEKEELAARLARSA